MKPTKISSLRPAGTMRYLPLLLSFVVLSRVVAEPSPSGDPPINGRISLDSCLTLARESSPELRIAANNVRASRLDRKLVGRTHWPQLSLSAGAGFAPVSLDFGYDPAVSNGGELGARVVAQQTLYSGGSVGLLTKQADTQVSQRSLTRQQQDRDIVYAVRLAFIDLLASERQRELTFQSVERLSEYADLVLDLNQSGHAKYADLLSARVELSRAKIDSGKAVQAVSAARINLNRLTGLPDDTLLEPAGSLDSLLLDAADTSISIAEKPVVENLDVSAARLDVRQNRLNLDLTRSQWKPTVSLTADAGVVTSRENLLVPPSERYRSLGYSVGLSIDMPLWDRGKRKIETARTKTEILAAEDNVALVRRNVAAEYQNTRLRLKDTLHRLASLRAVIQTAEKNYLLNTDQYADGNATAAEVLFAQQSLTDTHRSEIDALAEIQTLKARLDMITRPEQEARP